MKLCSAAFVVILFSVINDFGLQATKDDHGKKRRKVQSQVGEASGSRNAGSTSGDEWNLDSVIQFEIHGELICVATLLDRTGSISSRSSSKIITVDGTLHAEISAPVKCMQKIKADVGQVSAKTADGEYIRFEFNSEGDLILPDPAKVNVIPGARKKLSKTTKGMAAISKEGKVVLKQFVIGDHRDCGLPQKYAHSNDRFCAKNVGKEKINVGEGSPFFLNLDGRQVAMGIQIGYYSKTGGNIYKAMKLDILVEIPERELEMTSSGVFEGDSVINIEQNGHHLCLACAVDQSIPVYSSIYTPKECLNKMKENIEGVKYKTAKGEEIPVELSVVGDDVNYHLPNPSKVEFIQRTSAPLPIGTKGMAATWDNGNVVWKQFLVTPLSGCGVDQLVFALKFSKSIDKDYFCIKHVDGERVNAGLGSPFIIKVRASQYLVGIQVEYVDGTGGNIYYNGEDTQKARDE